MVFMRMLDDNDSVCPLGARLLVKGFFQKERVDYSENFALFVSFRVLLLFCGEVHVGNMARSSCGHFDQIYELERRRRALCEQGQSCLQGE